MATRMQQRRGTASQWTTANPILATGEIGFETDTGEFRMGDGTNHWDDLPPFKNIVDLGGNLDDYIPLDQKDAADGVATLDGDGQVPASQLGNVDLSGLATETFANSAVSTHSSDTANVHGIADTSLLATKSYADNAAATAVSGLVDAAPGALDTLNELAAAINDDLNFYGTVQTLVDDSVAAEATARDLAIENAVGDAISAETVDRNTAIETAIGTEVLDRNDAISDAISTEITNRNQAITAAIDTEVDNRNSAIETALQDSITTDSGLTSTYDPVLKTLSLGVAGTIATDTDLSSAISDHNSETENVHGITDTANLVYQSALDSGLAGKQDVVSGVSDAEIGYLDGVTSAIQTQIDGKADSSHSHAISDVTDLQTAIDSKAALAGANFTGNVEVDGNLVVDGDFTVNGTNFSASATSITIEDNLLQLAHQNPANTVDLGLVVGYNVGSSAFHSGIVKDVSEDTWKLFKGVETEPTTTVAFDEGLLDNLELHEIKTAGVVFTDGTQTKQGVPSLTSITSTINGMGIAVGLAMRDSLVEVNPDGQPVTITIPANSSVAHPVGTSVDILQTGSGQVTIAGADGVTVNATPGLKLRTQWSSATLFKRATDTWVVFGDLSA